MDRWKSGAVNDILGEPADFWECHVIYGVDKSPLLEVVTVVSRGTNILERSCVPPAGLSLNKLRAGARGAKNWCVSCRKICLTQFKPRHLTL